MTLDGSYAIPRRRPLRVYAYDPLSAHREDGRILIHVPYEPLEPGPKGPVLQVVDYDHSRRCLYQPVNLDHPDLLIDGGLQPTEADPRFHQQMVYAVARRVIESFEWSQGRLVVGASGKASDRRPPLRAFPHAFCAPNAFYDHHMDALLFGYFRADRKDPGPQLPGQTVYTCLSQDIVAHETAHAMTHKLRPLLIKPTNADVLAFHEGFADIVALFQHFSHTGPLREAIESSRADLRKPSMLIELAHQFGHARAMGKALRSAIGDPSKKLYESLFEPHQRGAILVAAVFDAFFVVYERRIRHLVHIATRGSGVLPPGNLPPELVDPVVREAARTARQFLGMCIRAFDYLPPVDVRFGDYLRALVTADRDLRPEDPEGLRAAMIEAFRSRGLYPDGIRSLAEDSLAWEPERGFPRLSARPPDPLLALHGGRTNPDAAQRERWAAQSVNFAVEAQKYARKYARRLGLWSAGDSKIAVRGFHWAYRIGERNELVLEHVVNFVQTFKEEGLGGLDFHAGATVITRSNGEVRYVIRKTPRGARLDRQRAFTALCEHVDGASSWRDRSQTHMLDRASFAAAHRGGF